MGQPGRTILVLPIVIGMNYGIWLVPIIPVTLYEARHAEKRITPMLAGMLTWSGAIFSYYAYYAVLLSLGKLIHFEHFNIFGPKDETFWYTYWHMFNGIILGQFLQWIIIAVIGGAFIGAVTFWSLHKKPQDLTPGVEMQKLED